VADPAVIVAVFDTGLTSTSGVVGRRLWTGQGWDVVPFRFGVSPDLLGSSVVAPIDLAFERGGPALDFDGHGTHIASVIAEETGNGLGLSGFATGVRVMPVKVCVGYWELMLRRAATGVSGHLPVDAGGCADADIAAGIGYAVRNGARVINLGLGAAAESPLLRESIAGAVASGVFVAASAGSSYQQGNPAEFPAAYALSIDGMMAVGAVGRASTRAPYSNTGRYVEIVAPGGSGREGVRAADAGLVWQVTILPSDMNPLVRSVPRFDRYAEVGLAGTSIATAHVSALAAFLAGQGVTLPADIEQTIAATARDLGTTGRDVEYGHGLIQAHLPFARIEFR
jgi:subtilisin family serine protease